jgi:DNA-binding beta-propeller fold protein YncE
VGDALHGRTELNELRGMVLYGDSLLVNNANKDSSMVIQYGGACSKESLREMRVVIPTDTPGVDHPYGLAIDHSYLYLTNQGTNTVLRFQLTTGEPADIAPAVFAEDGGDPEDYYPGLFHQFDPRSDGVRGIAIDAGRGFVYVADKDEGVLVLNGDGYHVGRIDVDKPIGVAICSARQSLVVGSKGDDTVVEYDLQTHKLKGEWSHKLLSHPAGLTCYGSNVYVVSQDEGMILEMDMDSGKTNVVVEGLEDVGEQLLLSHGNEC